MGTITVQRPPMMTAAMMEHQRKVAEMQENGILDRAARLLSMAYLTFSQANRYAEAANDMLEPYGMIHKKVKTTVNNLMQSFDAYDKVMQTLIHGDDGALRQLCFDSEMLDDMLDAFMLNNIEVERGPYYKAKLFLPQK